MKILESTRFTHLRGFQTALLVHDGTEIFCDRFIDPLSSLYACMPVLSLDITGYLASHILDPERNNLLNKADESCLKLKQHYEWVLREQDYRFWQDADHEAAVVLRRLHGVADRPDRADFFAFTELSAEKFANTQICLLRQALFLIHSSREKRQHHGLPVELSSSDNPGGFDTLLC
ncbi:hypothetical protein [Prosthecochloris sp. HL-130-GSB]|jgi:hypothetical protein|uniref:Uncharacterized protein n=1 Tax=Prosthecochloris aestuarii TaxID=1102 RepID=A0A831WPH0_PROAE|nr:hypothetical protein [Prosthecochloris sp. HL-130-GSB]HED31538.1 hypothetical protein [Prosthecochloris aestuarii]